MYREAHRKSRQLGAAGWAVFQIADTFQRIMVDSAIDALTFRPSSVGRIARVATDATREGLSLVPAVRSGRRPLDEAQALYRVFSLVRDVRRVTATPAGPFALLPSLARIDRFGFEGVWVTEGLGHEYAAERWRSDGDALGGLLLDRRIPRGRLTMLHAGMGLFFGEQLLQSATPYSGANAIRAAVDTFVDRCGRNAVTGFIGAAFEALGLVARTWFAEMVPDLVRALPEDLRGYFWHGAGRALFFLPVHAVPGIRSAWATADRETIDHVSGLNLQAGLAWAATLVNVRQPRVLEGLVRARSADLIRDNAFKCGVRSAIAMAADAAPGEPAIVSFLDYEVSDETMRDMWDEFVRIPAREGLDLGRAHAEAAQPFLGLLFRYRFPWEDAALSAATVGAS